MEFYIETKQLFNDDGKAAWTFEPKAEGRIFRIYPSLPIDKPQFATFDELLDSENFGATSRLHFFTNTRTVGS